MYTLFYNIYKNILNQFGFKLNSFKFVNIKYSNFSTSTFKTQIFYFKLLIKRIWFLNKP